ncbi:atpase aaa [Lasius niger]|uniref:Atpase aaa n=1 Tax=Lasius niger TaxID=67767 RepID=A0A0J7KD49_LASNI|nr:atpase aaa [Lasius niger]
MSLLLCAADPLAEPNASLPDGLPVGPSTPDSDNNDLPSAFSGKEAGYQKAKGTADVKQYGRMQVQPLNVPGKGFTLVCRDTNSNIMAQQKISTKQIDQSWEVYVDPDTNQGGTLINPIQYGMNPPLPKNTNGSTANLPDPNLPSNQVINGPDGQTYRFAFSLKSMPAVFNNSLGLSGSVWCGPMVDPLDTIQKTIKIELDRTTGNLLNPNMVSLPDGWSIQWSQP